LDLAIAAEFIQAHLAATIAICAVIVIALFIAFHDTISTCRWVAEAVFITEVIWAAAVLFAKTIPAFAVLTTITNTILVAFGLFGTFLSTRAIRTTLCAIATAGICRAIETCFVWIFYSVTTITGTQFIDTH
jgi:hypothetical protein